MSSQDEKKERSKCGQLRDYIDAVNRKQKEKGKPEKYEKLTFTYTFNDRWIVFVNHYEDGRIGPRTGFGMDGKNAAAAELLEILRERDTRILGFLNVNFKKARL